MPAFTPAHPYLATHTDTHGRTWQFAYWGSGFIYIREEFDDELDSGRLTPLIGANASRDDWPYLISLDSYQVRPETVTREWLTARASSWINARNNEDREATP